MSAAGFPRAADTPTGDDVASLQLLGDPLLGVATLATHILHQPNRTIGKSNPRDCHIAVRIPQSGLASEKRGTVTFRCVGARR
ncbi:hypothetical protein EDD30_5876 [Couchioplanes caeruleus]|uniref:Uncharacterized protein n=1 Tax=Couchioplanes caeruleus TaxID=56438 RepID=A0A3N1GRN7_9ACTN|nr:hypothetical protein EDD30_5876 [Couchioplanes caeruleus]